MKYIDQIFNKITDKKNLNYEKTTYKVHRTPTRQAHKGSYTWHITVKTPNAQEKEMVLKTARV